MFCITSLLMESAGASEYPPVGIAGASSALERASSTRSCKRTEEFPIVLLKEWADFHGPPTVSVDSQLLAQVRSLDMVPIIERCVHPLFRFCVPLRKATLDRTRRTVIGLEVDCPTIF